MRTTKAALEQRLQEMEAALFEAEAHIERLAARLSAGNEPLCAPAVSEFQARCAAAREEAMRTGRTVRVM